LVTFARLWGVKVPSRPGAVRRRPVLRWPAAALAGLAVSGLAEAQTVRDLTAKDDAVRTRSGPFPGPVGIELDEILGHLGLLSPSAVANKSSPIASFLVHPKFETELRHETNLYYEKDNRVADQTVVLRPELAIVSDWANHEFKFRVGGDIGVHRLVSSEDYQDAFVSLEGRVDVTDELNAHAGFRFERRHESRGRPDDPGRAVDPIVDYAQVYKIGTEYRPDRFLLRGDLSTTVLSYVDSPGFDGGERDRQDYNGAARFGYELLPGTTAFVEGRANLIDYRRDVVGGFRQGAHGYETLVGATWHVSGVTFAELAAGYLVERYDEERFKTIKGPTFSATLTWNATDLLTITANGARTIEETASQDASGIFVTAAYLAADFELRDDLVLTLAARYRNEDTRGIDRTEDVISPFLEVTYRFDTNFYGSLRFDHSQRFSAERQREYTAETVAARVGVQF
jgi:hypothetical protein